MTQEELDGCKLLAEWLYPEMLDSILIDKYGVDIDGNLFAKMALYSKNYDLLKYHSSYDWIMGVIEKIQKLGNYTIKILTTKTLRCEGFTYKIELFDNIKTYNPHISIESDYINNESQISTYFRFCIAFVKWYNS